MDNVRLRDELLKEFESLIDNLSGEKKTEAMVTLHLISTIVAEGLIHGDAKRTRTNIGHAVAILTNLTAQSDAQLREAITKTVANVLLKIVPALIGTL